MKAHNWFILGHCILAATFFHALSSQSFQVLHYVFIALGTFFIVGAFISGGGSIKTGDEARDPKEIGSKSIFKIKTLAYVLLICIAGAMYFFFDRFIIAWAQTVPWLWAVIQHFSEQMQGHTLLGLFYVAFIGSIFFTPLPVEVAVVYYLAIGYPIPMLLLILLLGAVLGEILNYSFGFALGGPILRYFVGEKFGMWQRRIEKFGGLVIFLVSFLPLPLGLVAVLLGGLKYPIKRFLFWMGLGRLFRYSTVIVLQIYFSAHMPAWLGSLTG